MWFFFPLYRSGSLSVPRLQFVRTNRGSTLMSNAFNLFLYYPFSLSCSSPFKPCNSTTSKPPPPDVFLRPSNWTASAWQSLFLLTRAAPSSYYLFFFLFLHSSFFCRVFPLCLYVSHTLNEGEWCDALFPVSPPIVFRVPNSFSSRHSIIWLDEWRNRKEVYSESSDYLDKLRIGIVLYDVGRSDPYFWANPVAAL